VNRKDEKVRTGRDKLVALVTTLPTSLPLTPVETYLKPSLPEIPIKAAGRQTMWEVRITWAVMSISQTGAKKKQQKIDRANRRVFTDPVKHMPGKREIPIGSAPAEKSESESPVCPEQFRLGGL